MREKMLFVCDFCGTKYTDKCKCEECEKGHKKPKKVKSSKYVSIFDNKPGYPTYIMVEMSDGTSQKYKKA